jgi:hypothetical protein
VSGNATFDLTQQGLDAPLNLVGGLWTTAENTATVTVSGGAGKMYFGGANTGINFIPFNTDVAFSGVENPEGVTFRNYSTVISWPASCPWSIADNATVALYGTNMLSAGDVFLTNYNIYVLSPTPSPQARPSTSKAPPHGLRQALHHRYQRILVRCPDVPDQ